MKHKTKKLLCSVLAFCQLFAMTAFGRPDWPSDTGIQAEAGALMDVDSGTMIFGQNSHVEYPPASITKLLTALVVLEHAELSDTVTYSETAMNSVEADSGNKYSLAAGDTMTVEDSLYALLLSSVNQSANALAEHVAGSIPAFVDMMNQKLTELWCSESHFEHPSGLNGDTQNVSAYDMAKIACAAFQNEKLLEISSSVSHEIGPTANNPNGFTVRQEHRLVITEDTASEFYCPEAVAGKTGYLLKAGNTLVTYGEKDGRRPLPEPGDRRKRDPVCDRGGAGGYRRHSLQSGRSDGGGRKGGDPAGGGLLRRCRAFPGSPSGRSACQCGGPSPVHL